MTQLPSKPLKRKILPILLGLFIGLLTIELCLRIFYFLSSKQVFNLRPQVTTLVFYDNRIFGSAFSPDQEGWFVTNTKEYATRVKINSQGWPDIEHSFTKPDGVFRILILGDSFVENLQVPFENRFFRQLQDKLTKEWPGRTIEVVTVGRGNTGPAQQYLILKNYGLMYNPDLVIQMFFSANDVANSSPILQNDPYLPYFRLDNNGVLEEIPHSLRTERKHSKIKDLLKSFRVMELTLSVRQKILEKKNNFNNGYPVDYHVYDETPQEEYQTAWNVTYRLITETKKLAEGAGAKYLFVSIPGSEQFQKNKQQNIFTTYSKMDPGLIDFEKPDKLLGNFCESSKLDCKFMLPVFREYSETNPDQPTYYYYDGHWTQTGTNLVADFLFTNLKDYFKIK